MALSRQSQSDEYNAAVEPSYHARSVGDGELRDDVVEGFEDDEHVVIGKPTGSSLRFGSFSSSYSVVTQGFAILSPVLTEREIFDVIQGLNESIRTFWPCHLVYFFGVCCAPCSLGLSLLCPNLCIGKAEESALEYLEQVSLKARNYDRGVRIRLSRSGWFSSQIEVSFPRRLLTAGTISQTLAKSD